MHPNANTKRAVDHAAEFRSLIEKIPDAVAVRQRGRFVYVNSAFALLLKYAHDEIVGRSLDDIGHADDRDRLEGRTATALTIESGSATVRFRQKGETWIALEVDPVQLVDFEGQPGRMFSARDPRERLNEQAKLVQVDRLASMGMLAAGVVHEINNPLTYVITSLDQAIETLMAPLAPGDGPELLLVLREAREGAERVRQVTRDLGVFSRDDDPARRERVDVRRVLDSAIQVGRNEIKHRARLVREYSEVPLVLASASSLGQVFLNLIVNAAQAMPPSAAGEAEREITVRTAVDDARRVIVEVADTGVGIEPRTMARLFEPFNTTKVEGAGTGLGLFICRRILERLGGEISVDSVVGRGTKFRVSLAALSFSDPPPPSRRLASLVPGPEPRGRILLLDDEPAIVAALKRALSRVHDIVGYTSPREALRLIESGARFDCILCDLMMPVMTGMQFHEAVRNIDGSQAQRIVFITGGAVTLAASAFLERVSNERVEKPFDLGALRARLLEWVGDARRVHQAPAARE